MTTSYRDFVMKMNIILAKKSIDWSIDLSKITDDEMTLYWDLIRHIFVFFSEFLFEESQKRTELERSTVETMKTFLELTNKLILFLVKKEPTRLFDLMWSQVNQEARAGELVMEGPRLVKVKIDGKDFIGADDQLPIMLKLMISVTNLMFKAGFTLSPSDFSPEKHQRTVAEHGWTRFGRSGEYLQNRSILLEIMLTLILAEKKFSTLNGYHANSVVNFFRSWKSYLGLLHSLLQLATGYEENGLLPYSGYFFKEFMESSMYLSALSITLSILFLSDETEVAKLERVNGAPILPVYFVKSYLANQGLESEVDDNSLFDDDAFLSVVLDRITVNVLAYFKKTNTLLPNSLKEVASSEPLCGGDGLFVAGAAEPQRQNGGHSGQTQVKGQHFHPPFDRPGRGPRPPGQPGLLFPAVHHPEAQLLWAH